MKAVIVYDDITLATDVKAMLERAGQRADATTRWDVKPWRVDLLRLKALGTAALTEAADAHLMVLALRESEALPAEVSDWLNQWATRRQVQEAALSVWHGGTGDKPPALATRDLSRFAERHGLSVILDNGGPAEDESARMVQSLNARAAARTSTLEHMLEQTSCDHYWGCGINE